MRRVIEAESIIYGRERRGERERERGGGVDLSQGETR